MNLRIVAVPLLLIPSIALAQGRAGKSEFYVFPVWTASKDYSFDGGSTARSDTGFGLGLGFAKNLSSQASVGVELNWSEADYRATVAPGPANPNNSVGIAGTIETYTVRFTGTYHFSPNRFTPFVTGGLGWTYVDTNIPTGLPQGVCWWYPWYGQVCTSTVPTASTTKFSYNAGAGLRYDTTGGGFVRGLVNAQYVDFGGSYGSTYWTQYRLDFGVRF